MTDNQKTLNDDQKDAARYRWLVRHANNQFGFTTADGDEINVTPWLHFDDVIEGETLSQAIDRHIATNDPNALSLDEVLDRVDYIEDSRATVKPDQSAIITKLKADNAKLREALEHIIKHQEAVCTGRIIKSTTWRIAREALAQKETI